MTANTSTAPCNTTPRTTRWPCCGQTGQHNTARCDATRAHLLACQVAGTSNLPNSRAAIVIITE
jgi:hypothetical protein